MDAIRAYQEIGLLGMAIGKGGDDCRMIGFLDLDAFGIVLNVDLLLSQDVQQSLSDRASGYSERPVAEPLLAPIENGGNPTQIPRGDELEFFIVPSLVGDPVVDSDAIKSAKGVGGKGDKTSVEGAFVPRLEDLA